MQLLKSSLILFIFSLPSIAWSDSPRDPYQFFFNETWGEFNEESEKARTEGKKAILIFFELTDCPFCHWMKTNVLNQPQVQAYYRQHFLNFSVDIEGDVEITTFAGEASTQKAFASENRVRATPVFGFFDFEGKRITRYIGRTSSVEEFMLLGRYVAEGHYQTMPFLKFKRQQKRKI